MNKVNDALINSRNTSIKKGIPVSENSNKIIGIVETFLDFNKQ